MIMYSAWAASSYLTQIFKKILTSIWMRMLLRILISSRQTLKGTTLKMDHSWTSSITLVLHSGRGCSRDGWHIPWRTRTKSSSAKKQSKIWWRSQLSSMLSIKNWISLETSNGKSAKCLIRRRKADWSTPRLRISQMRGSKRRTS